MSKRESLALNYSASAEGKPESSLDVVDAPDRIFEALHWIRALQLRGTDAEGKEMAAKAEELLKDLPACLAAAAVRLAEVA
jgi:hypothetical protein